MAQHKHLILEGTATAHGYTSPGGGGRTTYDYPARDRGPHAQKIKTEISAAHDEARQQVNVAGAGIEIRDITLEFFGAGGKGLETDRLDDRTSAIEILSTRVEGDRTYATVRVPGGKLSNFLAKVQRYETENDKRRKDKGPKNKELIESIEGVRLPVVRSFWTDADSEFPADSSAEIWWEVWLRAGVADHDEVFAQFVVEADRIGLRVSEQVVNFPERLVFLAYGSTSQWAGSLVLFGILAELRRAKEIPTDYVTLPPREQAEFVEDAAARLQAPSMHAPSVCLLDTGLNAGHPLLAPMVDESDLHQSHPDWSAADEQGHGTQMAGIAAYGDELAEHLAGSDPITPLHRLESVKLIHPTVPHDPDNYGYVTMDAVAQAEAAAPERDRVVCLAVTADDRDVGFPSLWSAAIDQHASGHDDDICRLYVVSAGNVRDFPAGSFDYPRTNLQSYGIEDPAQSYNAVTVGAYTELAHVQSDDPGYAGKSPIAPKGGLSPLSRTSVMWTAREWPFKPDIVMEGGNYLEGEDGSPEACDDLRLLTTTVDPTGSSSTPLPIPARRQHKQPSSRRN